MGSALSFFDGYPQKVLRIFRFVLKSVQKMTFSAVKWCVMAVYGISAGVFVGCIAAALAEILNTLPILFRRTKIKRGLPWIMTAMALGKMCGGLFYFLCGYGGS